VSKPDKKISVGKAGVPSQEEVYKALLSQLPEGAQHASGGLPDARGISDVDVYYRTKDHGGLLSQLPKGARVARQGDSHTIYDIPGYARPVSLYASMDPNKADSVRHRATALALAERYPELAEKAHALKAGGKGSEPSWAEVLGLEGDPYSAMANTEAVLAHAGKRFGEGSKTAASSVPHDLLIEADRDPDLSGYVRPGKKRKGKSYYHGSPVRGLDELIPSEARGVGQFENQRAIFLTGTPEHAALYAIGKGLKGKTPFGVTERNLVVVGDAPLPKGYVYEVAPKLVQKGPRGQYSVGTSLQPVKMTEIDPREYGDKVVRVKSKDELLKALGIKASLLKTAMEEFAPGIPKSREIEAIPEIEAAKWRLAIQMHDAERAGKHWDLRLVDPNKRKAHSWAVPKAKWPGSKNRLRLAIQQPTHSASYALNFEGNIPKGTYGAGDVKLVKNTSTTVNVEDGVVRFSVPRVGKMVLRKTDGDNWLLMRAKKAADLSGQVKSKTILKTNTIDRLRKLISATDSFKMPKGTHHIKLGPYGYAVLRQKKDGSAAIHAVRPAGANPPGRDVGKQLPKDRLRKILKSRWKAGSSSAIARLINILTKKSSFRSAVTEVAGGDTSYESDYERRRKREVSEYAPEAEERSYSPRRGVFGEKDRTGGDDFGTESV